MSTRDLSIAEPGYEGLNFETMVRECLESGVLAIDSKGQIIAATPEAERALPLISFSQATSVDALPDPLQALIREVQRAGQPVIERQILLPSGSGDPTPFSAAVFSSPAGTRSGLVVLLKENSRSGRLEQNLRQLDRLATVGTLSASMAHEVKNALVSVKTFIDLLLERNQDSELASVVRREMGRMDAIVCHMLKFAAPAHPCFVRVRLHDVLDHSLRVAQLRVGGKAITFQREFHASPDTFTGDDHQLEQAFANLLLNAVEAIGTEGSLTVATDLVSDETSFRFREAPATGEFLRVKITDSGGGISAELLPRIFDPFFTTKPAGTGLGLAVTRRIVEEHGGRIRVDSRLDHGTTFTILLPTARP